MLIVRNVHCPSNIVHQTLSIKHCPSNIVPNRPIVGLTNVLQTATCSDGLTPASQPTSQPASQPSQFLKKGVASWLTGWLVYLHFFLRTDDLGSFARSFVFSHFWPSSPMLFAVPCQRKKKTQIQVKTVKTVNS